MKYIMDYDLEHYESFYVAENYTDHPVKFWQIFSNQKYLQIYSCQ